MGQNKPKYYSEGDTFIEAKEIIYNILGDVKEDDIQYQSKEWCDEKMDTLSHLVAQGGILCIYCFMREEKDSILQKLARRYRGALNREELIELILEGSYFEEIERKDLEWCVRIYNVLIRLLAANFLTEDIIEKDDYLYKLTVVLAQRINDLGGHITEQGHAYS